MASIVWSEDALNDVGYIHAYIARDSPANAARMVDRIQAATDRLEMFPESGRTISEDVGYRQVLVRPYRVIYSYDPGRDVVTIAAVIHGRRQLPPLGGDR